MHEASPGAVFIPSSISGVGACYGSLIKATLVIQSRQHVLTVRIGLHQLFVSITTFVFESLLSSYSTKHSVSKQQEYLRY